MKWRNVEYWTLDQVREYLGVGSENATRVWLSRHKIPSERFYSVRRVRAARERK